MRSWMRSLRKSWVAFTARVDDDTTIPLSSKNLACRGNGYGITNMQYCSVSSQVSQDALKLMFFTEIIVFNRSWQCHCGNLCSKPSALWDQNRYQPIERAREFQALRTGQTNGARVRSEWYLGTRSMKLLVINFVPALSGTPHPCMNQKSGWFVPQFPASRCRRPRLTTISTELCIDYVMFL